MRKVLVLTLLAVISLGISPVFAGAQGEQAPTTQAAPAFNARAFVRDFVNSYLADLVNGNKIVPSATLIDMITKGENPYIVDIRSADDYAAGHLKGAVNVPWGTPGMWETVKNMPTDKPVYVHCYSGQTSGQAFIFLRMAGVNAFSVASGWNLGISKAAGFDAVVETTANSIDTSYNNGVKDEVVAIIRSHYEDMATKRGTPFANFFVSPENAHGIWLAKDPGVVFVAIHRPEDFAQRRIDGAINVPYAPQMVDFIGNMDPAKTYIFHCYTGQGSNQTVALLRPLGFDVLSMTYGLGTPATNNRGWALEGYPVVGN